MAPATEADTDNNFETHEWKSEFASTRSGRSSPNIFAKVRRKLLLTPPVRNARSPRLTDEELDALTGDLPYATNYTYAYSKIYDPSLPDHWEVPNLAGGISSGTLAEQEHWSSASISRQLLYILRFPVYLFLHAITYILEAFYHVIKISTFTFWDYLVYLYNLARTRYGTYQDNRRRTALIRNRQDSFNTKLARFIRHSFETIIYIALFPYRMFTNRNTGVEQYQYKSIKNQLENERASRVTTRSQNLERSRKFEGLSQSPARRVTPGTIKSTTITRITAKVFSSSQSGAGTSTSDTNTPTVVTTRTVKERSVTPRFRSTRQAVTRGAAQRAFDDEVDTPLSTYGLRSRGQSHLNTPEPTFDIGHAAATSTPMSPRTLEFYQYVENDKSKVQSLLTWLGYIILFPFFAAKHIWYTIYDYGKSGYMKLTNYEPTSMESIRVRDVGEPVPSTSDNNQYYEIDDLTGMGSIRARDIAKTARSAYEYQNYGVATVPWTAHVSQFFSSFFSAIKESHQVVFAMLTGAFNETISYVGSLFSGIVDKRSSKFSWCQLLGLLLALLLALFLFGFLTSDNTAIRVKELEKETNVSKSPDNALPAVPIWKRAGNYVKNYTWMVKEFIYDIAFNTYNYLKPVIGRTITAPRYAWDLIVSGFGAVGQVFGSILTAIEKFAGSVWSFGTGGFSSASNSTGEFLYGAYRKSWNGITSIAGLTKSIVQNTGFFIFHFFSSVVKELLNLSTTAQNWIVSLFKNTSTGISNFLYNYIYAPITGFFTWLTGNYKELLQPVWSGLRYIYDLVVLVTKTIVDWAWFLVTYPINLITRGWVRISEYAPEDVVQVFPIPQAITPTPDIDRKHEQNVDTLPKIPELEDEEPVIKPAPAPQPIPLPAPTPEPVIIHQTNVVETVDKEAIIKEVTDKLRAELSAQFHQELSAKLEQNYNTIIEKLKVENNNIQYDNNHLEAIIRQLIYEYDTDKTGQVDYALESAGGAVVSTRCSETYQRYTRMLKFWNIPIYYQDYSPRVVIQRNSKSLFPGECWCFKEGRGYIAVELSHHIDVSSISYEHIGKEVAPEGNRMSAPKGVLVWAYKQIDDLNSRVLIGDYTYDLDGPPLQFFIAKHKPDFPVKFVELEVTSNYGAPYTCLYRLRVHGKMLKMQ